MKTKTEPLTHATVDFDDAEQAEELESQVQRRAGVLARRAVKRLQDQGILDSQGRRVKRKLPADMRDNSECGL